MLKKIFSSCRSGDEDDPVASGELSNMGAFDNDPNTIFLHGTLSIGVIEARNVEGRAPSFFRKFERVVTSSVDGVDPYCSVKIGYNKIMQTPVVQNSAFPVWDSHCNLNLCHNFSAVEFRVKADKRPGPLHIISKVKHLSMLSVPAYELVEKKNISGWFPLGPYRQEFDPVAPDATDSHDTDASSSDEDLDFGEIFIQLEYTPITEDPRTAHFSVPNSYFPVRKGIDVKLYQDADCPPGSVPQIPFRQQFEHRRCWIEMANSIMDSTEFIYVAGWSVWPELVMVRTPYPGDRWQGLTLGEMLKQKAEEGVCVCVLVWDELASNRFSNGLMNTHDEQVISYFRKSKVCAVKASRQNPKDGPLADLNDAVLFTHHQKTVVVTRRDRNSGRHRVEAWVGGLDLTHGRYDNQKHSLFRTLDKMHSPPDFVNACAPVLAATGPREPWHDIHSHITGTAAWDVLTNFEGRWIRQSSPSKRHVLHLHTAETFIQPSEEDAIRDGAWNVQVLRSINESSTALKSGGHGLVVRRSAATDQSIHNAYVHHIRNAKHFIYMENQYFIGSSHLWDSGQRGGFAANLVPIELAEKICAKIRANQRFVVYLNIPMFSEGAPDSGAVQEILSHQRKSIALISSRVTQTLREVGSDSRLSEYFNVFCLVNRESAEGGKGDSGSTVMEKRLAQSRRFMVYIHSKFAVFDDTVAIIGSANINSRSLDGSRDTEIAISTWQNGYEAKGPCAYTPYEGESSLPQGDVAAFRASVWSEHLGGYMEEFEYPSSLECIVKMRELAEHNWLHFASNEESAVADMPHGHLALYPYEYDNETGEITTMQTTFPDFDGALVKGRATPGIPNMLTG